MKTILYIHQYFNIPKEGGSLRSYFIARALVQNGYLVHMITSHNKPKYEIKPFEGITVHYLPVPYSNTMSFGKRSIAFLKFVFATIRQASKIPKPDLIYATSTPLTVGIIALWMKWRKGIPYIFEVRDLWPEAPIQLGVIKNPIVQKLAQKLEMTIYKKASSIIALSPGIEADIKKKVSHPPIMMIPNMADIDFYSSNATSKKTDGEFVIGYFGAFGMANHVEFIIQIALECQNLLLPIRFILAGEGAKKVLLEKRIEQFDLKNIEPHSIKSRFEVRDLMNQVDACITSFQNIPILETNSPNKFFDGLAAGKLSIVNINGWMRNLVEIHECGIFIDPNKPEEFAEKIKPFLEDLSLLKKYQNNARKLAYSKFSKNELLEKIVSLVNLQWKMTNI
jgi:glycosyltransferase involved in cell wall biosynthesis